MKSARLEGVRPDLELGRRFEPETRSSMRLFLDTNVPTYAAGREHPLKEPCKEVLGLAAGHPGAFRTDAEVLQEMLHRYLSLRRWPEGKRIIADFATVMSGSVETVRAEDVVLASELADRLLGTSLERSESDSGASKVKARDFLHVAVMLRTGCDRIFSADKDFDRFAEEGIQRLDPAEVHHWRAGLPDTGGAGLREE